MIRGSRFPCATWSLPGPMIRNCADGNFLPYRLGGSDRQTIRLRQHSRPRTCFQKSQSPIRPGPFRASEISKDRRRSVVISAARASLYRRASSTRSSALTVHTTVAEWHVLDSNRCTIHSSSIQRGCHIPYGAGGIPCIHRLDRMLKQYHRCKGGEDGGVACNDVLCKNNNVVAACSNMPQNFAASCGSHTDQRRRWYA